MKNIFRICFFILTVQSAANAQNLFVNGGTSGIATVNSSNWNNVGIGISTPQTKFEVFSGNSGWHQNIKGWAFNPGEFVGLKLVNGYGGEYFKWAGIAAVAQDAASNRTGLALYAGQSEKVRITYEGVVLINQTTLRAGAAAGKYKLDVLGGVRADMVVVNTDGADFVFAKNYRLRPLSEVESFIQANHHLPEIAPAAQMQAEGVSVGELQTQLLQKVEELTLYLIEQNKQLQEQKKESDTMKQQLQEQNQKVEEQAMQLQKLKKENEELKAEVVSSSKNK